RRRHAIVDDRLRVVRRARLQRRGMRAAVKKRERRSGRWRYEGGEGSSNEDDISASAAFSGNSHEV
ncbi:MAG TPA: hypothetical protein VNN25_25325, partial [Thermoanaerobaculia bacterium]|nr:hypothetical protein [Thermoanaerobaculia bacterium]